MNELIKLHGDGPSWSPLEYAAALERAVRDLDVEPDDYSRGGIVDALEERMASLLGKERAVFVPTGTLANHLAVRAQARGRTRVIVQSDSHLYNDAGDAASVLSNLSLVPLAQNDATFSVDDVRAVVERTATGKVSTGVGVISIESPMRRRLGEMFDRETATDVCAYARENGIATHLDGARLFMAAPYANAKPAELAAPFDTVYVSLWKYLNAPSGAILAGPADVLSNIHDDRRMFGGGLPHAWPDAALALHSLAGFEERFAAAVARGEELIAALESRSSLRVERIHSGSNIFKLHMEREPAEFRARLAEQGVELPAPAKEWRGFAIHVNETLTRMPLEEFLRRLTDAC